MPIAEPLTYLAEVTTVLRAHCPDNRVVNIICHGHSVPAGYFATPRVDSLNAYPHLLHAALAQRFPFAVINCIVTAIGGESSPSGAERFEADALCHRPDVVTIDYGLNDRGMEIDLVRDAWTRMITAAKAAGAKVLLLTPTADMTQHPSAPPEGRNELERQALQVRELAAQHEVGLVDSFAAFERYTTGGGDLTDLLSWSNHPNRAGHELVARELLRWFPAG